MFSERTFFSKPRWPSIPRRRAGRFRQDTSRTIMVLVAQLPAVCAACHSGRPQPVPDRKGLYRQPPFRELGIGCENCHAPGQLHVQARLKGKPLRGKIDNTIVNPDDLSPWLADNICMSCHEEGDARVLRSGKRYTDFRPGTPLSNTLLVFSPPRESRFCRRRLPWTPTTLLAMKP